MGYFAIIVIVVCGFLFPKMLIAALKSSDKQESPKYQLYAQILLAIIMLNIGLFLNTLLSDASQMKRHLS